MIVKKPLFVRIIKCTTSAQNVMVSIVLDAEHNINYYIHANLTLIIHRVKLKSALNV